MDNGTKKTKKRRYAIDLGEYKYMTRYDRLLHILFHANELPTDLYLHMNMSQDNYRKAISMMKKKGLIKRISENEMIGHVLTKKGKDLTRRVEYMRYRSCLEDSYQYDIIHRRRKRQFAYLYALFDRAGIPYENYAKPPLNQETVLYDDVYFYTALDVKRMLGIESTAFKGSRLFGFLIGKGRIVPVYRTNCLIRTFSSYEGLVPIFLQRFFGVWADTAILICGYDFFLYEITQAIIDNRLDDPKAGIHTAKYQNFYIFLSGDSFLSCIEDLYADHEEAEESIIERFRIDTSEKDAFGRCRLKMGTGFIDHAPVLVCAGNVNVVKLKRFVQDAELRNIRSYIICKKRDYELLQRITEDKPIEVIAPL